MRLIADGAGCAAGQHPEALVIKRGLALDRAKISPGSMEGGSHTQTWFGERLIIAIIEREVVVAPATGGQRLDLPMTVIGHLRPNTGDWIAAQAEPAVEKHGQIGS